MTRFKKVSAISALAASLAMAASPVAAANVDAGTARASIPADAGWQTAEGDGNYYRRNRHHRRGVDAGDVIAGVLILGGIAAVASAASKNRTERRYPEPQPRYPDSQRRSSSGQGIDRAVDMCLSEIERDVRVESVDSVDRTGEGWEVTGRIYNGEGFNCRIDNNGRVDGVSFGGRTAQWEDRQWNDERYAQARRDADAGYAAPNYSDDQLPAYPGGPIGDETEQSAGGYGG